MEAILQFFIVFVCVTLGSYIREYFVIMNQNEKNKTKKNKQKKPSARKIFSIALIGTILLTVLNVLVLKLNNELLFATAVGFGWLGLEFIMFLSKNPESLLSSIPGLKGIMDGYKKYREEVEKAKKPLTKDDVRREGDPK